MLALSRRWALAFFGLVWTTTTALSIPTRSTSSINRAASSSPSHHPPNPAIGKPYLHTLAKAQGKLWFGTATNVYGASAEELNEEYMTILNSSVIFGQLTPVTQMKFATTEPEQGVFYFTAGDHLVDLAASTDKKYIRCHNLVWGSSLPNWLSNGSWTNATLTAVMQNHISSLIAHFGTACYSWDVVNEALNADGTFRPNIWYNIIGREYFFLAFKFAAEAVASLSSGENETEAGVKLYYNDYSIESPSAKIAAAAVLVKELQNRGIQIDGVALESHFEVGNMPNKTRQIAAMESFTSLGVDVVRSEIDIKFTSLPYTAAGLEKQKQNYQDTIASCMAVDRCVGMTVWNFADAYSWVPAVSNHTQGGADLYNERFVRKPAYYGVAEALAATSGSSWTTTPAHASHTATGY